MIFCFILALFLTAASTFFFRGKGAGFIAGFNTLPPEKQAEFDRKKLCRPLGVLCVECALLLFAIGIFSHLTAAGQMDKGSMVTFVVVYQACLVVSIVLAVRHMNKSIKK